MVFVTCLAVGLLVCKSHVLHRKVMQDGMCETCGATGEMAVHESLVRKLYGRRQCSRLKYGWKDRIKINHREIDCENVD